MSRPQEGATLSHIESARKHLAVLADAMHLQLAGLSENPTVAGLDAVASNLDGARRAVLRISAIVAQGGQ